MTTIILTLAQARDLQRQITAWPSSWHVLFAIPIPENPDSKGDAERITAGMRLVELGCSDVQIAEQLGWKYDPETHACGPVKTIHRLIRRNNR